MSRRIEVVTNAGVSRLYVDGRQELSKMGEFTPEEISAIRAPKPEEPLKVRVEWRRPCPPSPSS